MPAIRRLIAPLTVAAAVAGGGVAGAVLGVPGLSGAQEDSSTTTTTPPADAERPDRGPGHRGAALDAAAEALGMTRADLVAALRDGKTIADVAAEKGVDVATVVDAMVAALEEELPSEADIRERVENLVENGRPAGPDRGFPGRGPGGPGAFGHGHRVLGAGLDAAAEALGISRDDLITALRDGKTIAEVAQEQGVDVNAVIDAMAAEARERISDFVNNGIQKPEVPEDGTSEEESGGS
jgi:hypothetical protein